MLRRSRQGRASGEKGEKAVRKVVIVCTGIVMVEEGRRRGFGRCIYLSGEVRRLVQVAARQTRIEAGEMRQSASIPGDLLTSPYAAKAL